MARWAILGLVPAVALAGGDVMFIDRCIPPSWLNADEMMQVYQKNCDKVNNATLDFNEFQWQVTNEQNVIWKGRSTTAQMLCQAARTNVQNNNIKTAADLAVQAWGQHIMNGTVCCPLPHAPFCLDTRASATSFTVYGLFAWMIVMFLGSLFASMFLRPPKEEVDKSGEAGEASPLPLGTVLGPPPSGGALAGELQDFFLRSHSLRVLPGAREFAASASGLFGSLQKAFDFQDDSVRNQFEHLLSLLLSHCAMVADRDVQEEDEVQEDLLLTSALRELHTELLEGFRRWRSNSRDELELPEFREGVLPPLAGVRWTPLPATIYGGRPDHALEASRQLAEITAYLLVWGESGNVRFMPEVVYFLTEMVLGAEAPGPSGFYGDAGGGRHDGGSAYQSGKFLSKVIRPIYNVVFNEWYEKVEKNGKKDRKKLHEGFEAFLPPDVANYDDWNELFCDAKRLASSMVLQDGETFFDIDHGSRFASVSNVAWDSTLDRYETKTHREVHSLWGFLASTHRVWLVHMLLFATGLTLTIKDPAHIDFGHVALLGNTFPTRLAAIGLIVPLHAILWGFARYETTGAAVCRRISGPSCWFAGLGRTVLWASPLFTYAVVRYVELKGEKTTQKRDLQLGMVLTAHAVISVLGLVAHLFFPDRTYDRLFERTPVHTCLLVVRYTFWFFVFAIKFLVSFTIFASVYHLMNRDLHIIMLGQQSVTEMKYSWSSVDWGKDVLEWALLWFTTFFLFCADTGMWFTLGCTFLGVGTYFVQRSCEVGTFCMEDAVAKIPERMTEKVFCFVKKQVQGREMAREFPLVWDRVVEYMRYEDKIGNQFMADQSFMAKVDGRHGVEWSSLSTSIQPALSRPGAGAEDGSAQLRITVPNLFKEQSIVQRACQAFVRNSHWPTNAEIQWRLLALSRGLGLPIPKPFRAPYMPGITVLIPHYGETIIEQKDSLYGGRADDTVPLMDWLKARYEDEWLNFDARMQAKRDIHLPHGANWDEYTDEQWEKICGWSSMRLQTLYRTVAGMMLYHPALQCHYEVQGVGRIAGEKKPALAQVWTPNDCFSCIVSMQQYANFEPVRYKHTNQMFAKFPSSLKVAYIDQKDKNVHAEVDNVHPRQHRRYFSCLIDGSCADIGGGRRQAKFTVELPGYPILGDGKSDNQNHAIIFLRGTFSQCIDANQGGYFEQMLMLPCVLGEFRTAERGDNAAKQIIGLPEHITSDIGSVGDFAAGSEVAFGTILQRTYAVLGARMHYGHPDIMNKQFMMQQGGVSKATKTINLSEDIFAGMDFTLRGQGRSIKHCEYFHVAKGRDLGFNTVLGFFSKLSSGAGEQILTRQMFRLGQLLHLPEALTFYYAHVGYYITQGLVSASMPILVFAWMVVLAADCEETFKVFENYCPSVPAAQAMANLLSVWYSWVIFLFLVATSMPLFAESWMERSFCHAVWRLGKQYLTLSFLMFVFQAKIIGYYVTNELRYGGAQYVATGRGLPTYRRPFIGEIEPGTTKLTKVGGLYLDYAMYTYYDGMRLLASCIAILLLGGVSDAGGQATSLGFTWLAIGITILSWLYGPFVFNPYQFDLEEVRNDVRAWIGFFLEDQGKLWVENYQKTQLKPLKGFRESVIGASFLISIFCLAVWFSILTHKLQLLETIYSAYTKFSTLSIVTLLPPVGLSLLYCLVVSVGESILGCPRVVVPPAAPRKTRALDLEGASSSSESESEEAGAMGRTTLDAVGVPVHDRMLDTVVERPLESDDEDKRGCKLPEAVPLAFSALIVTAIELIEGMAPLYLAFDPLKGSGAGWSKTFVSGLVLKYLLYEIVLFVSEGVLRSRCFDKVGSLLQFLSLWVHSNRMFRDMFVSGFILVTLSPLVLLDTINAMLCDECSLHNLLVYRDPGHLAKQAFALHYTAEESDSAEDGLASGRRASRSASRTLGSLWGGVRTVRAPSVPPTTTYR